MCTCELYKYNADYVWRKTYLLMSALFGMESGFAVKKQESISVPSHRLLISSQKRLKQAV